MYFYIICSCSPLLSTWGRRKRLGPLVEEQQQHSVGFCAADHSWYPLLGSIKSAASVKCICFQGNFVWDRTSDN